MTTHRQVTFYSHSDTQCSVAPWLLAVSEFFIFWLLCVLNFAITLSCSTYYLLLIPGSVLYLGVEHDELN